MTCAAGERLYVEDLTVGYGRRKIIEGLTLPPIASGKVTVLIGPNGAGKSTILKALAQVVPSQGNLRLGSMDLRRISARMRTTLTGFMPQALPEGTELTAIESVIVALRSGGAGDYERAAVNVLEQLDIAGLALRPLDRLSGGERQLVSLAQAVARSPRLLFLDEPTSALDLARQFQVMQQVRAIADGGAAVVMVLHDLALAAQWADQVIVLHAGRLHGAGAPHEVVTPPMLAEVYGVAARVERLGDRLFVVPQHAIGLGAPPGNSS